MIFLIVIVIILFLVIIFNRINYKIIYDCFTFFEGPLGSGKTRKLTNSGVHEYNKRLLYNVFVCNKFVKFLINFIAYIFPFTSIVMIIKSIVDKKLFLITIDKRGLDFYTNYPVRYRKYIFFGKWIWSKVVDITLFNWLIKYNQDCIISMDEMGFWFPPTTNAKGVAVMTDKAYTFGLTWLRHAISPCVFCASQSMDEINISFRRKVQKVYRLSNSSRVFFRLSRVSVIEIQRSEDTGSIITTFNDTDKGHRINWHYYFNPKNNFASRYAKYLYFLKDNVLNDIQHNYDKLLKYLELKAGDCWKELYYFESAYENKLRPDLFNYD